MQCAYEHKELCKIVNRNFSMCWGKQIISKYYLNRFTTLTNKGWVHLIPLKFPRVPKKNSQNLFKSLQTTLTMQR